MKFINIISIFFIYITSSVEAESSENLIKELKLGNKLIFIRHAYAPGVGDPKNFKIKDCQTQRNLNEDGKKQAKKIGDFFVKNKIPFDKVYSSEWCRCKDTALIAFKEFETKDFLNSFYSKKFSKNKKEQIENLFKFVKKIPNFKNTIFITHYVVISETLNYKPSSGEIIIADKEFNKIDSMEVKY